MHFNIFLWSLDLEPCNCDSSSRRFPTLRVSYYLSSPDAGWWTGLETNRNGSTFFSCKFTYSNSPRSSTVFYTSFEYTLSIFHKKKFSSHSEHSLLPLPSIFDVIIDFTNNIKDIDLLSLNFYPYLYLCSPDIFSQQHHCLSPLRNLDAHFVSISCLL